MRTRRGKRKAAPAIVPRFLKGAVTIGAIPAIAAACGPSQRQVQPVVAYMAAPAATADDAASVAPNPPPPPVVAAYQPAADAQPVSLPVDAGVDAPPKKAKTTKLNPPPPPPPPVVAAMMPRDVVMPKTKQ
ncbi:MAG TPA: hypothetical protein VFQ65_05430 [Kofleriaceae bacterium]|nr:hypothetical protein [Kofleriaceae bacterium]